MALERLIWFDDKRVTAKVKDINKRLNIRINSRSLWTIIDEVVMGSLVDNYDSIAKSKRPSRGTMAIKKAQAASGTQIETLKGVFSTSKVRFIRQFGKRTGTLEGVFLDAAVSGIRSGKGYEKKLVARATGAGFSGFGDSAEYSFRLKPRTFVKSYPKLLDEIMRASGAGRGLVTLDEQTQDTIMEILALEIANQLRTGIRT